MHVAVFEFLCSSGSYSDSGRAGPYASLLDEGAAMLLSLASDLDRCGHHVSVALETSIRAAWKMQSLKSSVLDRVDVHDVHPMPEPDIEPIAELWASIARASHCAIVIAPELDGLLSGIVQAMRQRGCRIMSANNLFLCTASDKWDTYLHWTKHQQITAPTMLANQWLEYPSSIGSIPYPSDGWVLKRRFGAGGTDMQRFDSSETLCDRIATLSNPLDWIVQPWIIGQPASLAVVGPWDSSGKIPVAAIGPTEQLFKDGSYIGGQGPLAVDPKKLDRFTQGLLMSIPGATDGWVGIDFLILPNGQWIPLEINPRLTSSYLGYRKLYGPELANTILGEPLPIIQLPIPGAFRFSVSDFHG